MKLKQCIVVRNDIKMRKSKFGAQVGHAVLMAVLNDGFLSM